jgi:predicted transcriptional regulator
MDDLFKEALGIVKAQAGHRVMTVEEITSMMQSLAAGLQKLSSSDSFEAAEAAHAGDFKKAIKENSVTCLECGKSFKILTKRHFALHNLTAEEYRAKHGYKKGAPLVAKGLARQRRKKIKDMRLWEKRKPKGAPAA